MFSFFKKKTREAPAIDIPEWASFFTAEEYRAFLDGVGSYFRGMNVTCALDDGTIDVDPESFRFSKLGLSNIARVCKQHAIGDYPALIEKHFATMLKALEIDHAFDDNIADFGKIKPYLAVRLCNAEYMTYIGGLDEEGEGSVSRPVADDVYAMLVLDLPEAMRNVRPAHLLQWGMDEDALFAIGIANIRENYPMQITREDMGDFMIWFVNNDHFFTANILYELENRPELVGRQGSLIAIPHRHSALVYPIEDLGVVDAIQKMIPAAHGMHGEGPGPLTPNLFWYHDGVFTLMPYEVREEKLHFIPPEPFLEMLNRLENRLH